MFGGKKEQPSTIMKLLQFSFIAYLISICTMDAESKEECQSPQYIEIGSAGIIQCSFSEDVYSLLWYNSTKFDPANAILTLVNSMTSGKGFDSGEFDIFPNGSLIINNVSIKHDGTYSVIELETPTSSLRTYTISVLVVAHTFDRIPVIGKCDNRSNICFQTFDQTSEIPCTVRDARPQIPLSLMVRTIYGDRNLSFALLFLNETYPFVTSRVTTTNPFAYSAMITLIVCKAFGPPGVLERNESLLLLQNTDEILTSITPKGLFVEKDSNIQLHCIGSHITFLVWQVNRYPEVIFKTILFAVFGGENFTHINDEDYKLNTNYSVVIDKVGLHHEGTYRCISGNGLEDDVTMYDVAVFVFPDPAYPVVYGCNHRQYCVLEVQPEGSLTCAVNRIWPQVDLDISKVFGSSSNGLHFYDKKTTIRNNIDTFDVLLTSKYRFTGAAESRLTVECKLLGTKIDDLHLSTKFDLLFSHGEDPSQYTTATTETSSSFDAYNYWIIIVALVVILVYSFACGLVLSKVHCRRCTARRQERSPQRMVTLAEMERENNLSNGDSTEEKKDMFITELKAKYRDLYDAVQPIPYIRDRLYCVDRVFIESGIEYLVAKKRREGQETWEKLSSYHSILDDDRVKSTRRIIEGDPGYGKSTLTLQLSYDWCNKVQQSYTKDSDVLILLRLRQLGGVKSVYRAIKQFLLPKDSKLTEIDVENIIRDCSSVLVILDGYDEYPDQDAGTDFDVISIIMREMFQQFDVILTTRSSYLPKKYPPLTKRLKLTGFDDNVRDQYIRKAVVGDNGKAVDKINKRLKGNPVLGYLCQVPLFFVIFAHMSHESAQFQKLNSVTHLFRHMISCLHSHMKNKMEDKNVNKYDSFETDHRELDMLAFEGLSGKGQQIVWNKREMCERLEPDFYDQYLRVGILVEEQVLDISDDPSYIEHIQHKTEVRFYHKLFCEWYAAHHLLDNILRDDVTFESWEDPKESEEADSDKDSLDDGNNDEPQDIENQTDHCLKYLDPFDLQYVYMFTCGLDPVAAEKIIGYLTTRKDARKFAILCILEKSGKVEDVLKYVNDLCSNPVYINNDDSLLLQRSTIQLLEIALANKISISYVYLHNSYSTVDLSGGNHLQLKNNLSIPVLTTLNKLTIQEDGKEITAEEFAYILQYSSTCLALKELTFYLCLLPQTVQAQSASVHRSRNVKVNWGPRGVPTKYCLNLTSGLWKHYDVNTPRLGGAMTDYDYQCEMNWISSLRHISTN